MSMELGGYDFEIKTYFNSDKAINPKCLAILPMEPKRKLQKCKDLSLVYGVAKQQSDLTYLKCSCHREPELSRILGVQERRDHSESQIPAGPPQRHFMRHHLWCSRQGISLHCSRRSDSRDDEEGQGVLQAGHVSHRDDFATSR